MAHWKYVAIMALQPDKTPFGGPEWLTWLSCLLCSGHFMIPLVKQFFFGSSSSSSLNLLFNTLCFPSAQACRRWSVFPLMLMKVLTHDSSPGEGVLELASGTTLWQGRLWS